MCLDDKPEEAEKAYSKVNVLNLNQRENVAYIATNGLIQYRKKNYEIGKKFYQEALAKAKDINDNYLYRLALVNYCREEVRAKPSMESEIEQLLKNLKAESEEKQIQVELDRIEVFLAGKNSHGNFNFI